MTDPIASPMVETWEATYPMPKDGWVCFHCGVRFTSPGAARDHFGEQPTARPACTISAAELRAELMEYRELESVYGVLDARTRKIWEGRRRHLESNQG